MKTTSLPLSSLVALAGLLASVCAGCGDDTGGGSGGGEDDPSSTSQTAGGSGDGGSGDGGSSTTGSATGSGGAGGEGAELDSCAFFGRLEGARTSDIFNDNQAGGGCGHANYGGNPIGYRWDVVLEGGERLFVFLDMELTDGFVGPLPARYFVTGEDFQDPLWASASGACSVVIASNTLVESPFPELPDTYDFTGSATCAEDATSVRGDAPIRLAGELRFQNRVYHRPEN